MSVVKEGYIKRHSKNLFSGGWNPVYVKLFQDSYLLAYKKQGDREPKVKIFMKDVCKHFAFGDHVTKNFKDLPELPSGGNYNCLLAIPEKPSHKAKPHYFLLNNEQELHEWMAAICNTLPQREPKQEMMQPTSVPQQNTGPPPAYSPYNQGPSMPQPGPIGFGGYGPGAGGFQAPPPQQPYPQQAPYAQQAPYPQQQPYAPQGYPQQPYPVQQPYPQQQWQQQPGSYGYQPPPQGYAPPPQGYAPPPQRYAAPGYPQQQVVYVQDHHKKKGGLGGVMGSNTGKMAAGLIGGAALGYGASRMMGGGMGMGFGGFGMGRCGSWSSLSSFGSCGSFGSFGSFG